MVKALVFGKTLSLSLPCFARSKRESKKSGKTPKIEGSTPFEVVQFSLLLFFIVSFFKNPCCNDDVSSDIYLFWRGISFIPVLIINFKKIPCGCAAFLLTSCCSPSSWSCRMYFMCFMYFHLGRYVCIDYSVACAAFVKL